MRWQNLWSLVSACFVGVIAAGCGGEAPDDLPNDPAEPVDLGESRFDASERNAVMKRLADEFERLVQTGAADPHAAWVVYARGQPELEYAATADQVVWARFTDGRMFAFFDNFDGAVGSLATSVEASRSTRASAALSALPDSPGGRRALLVQQNLPDTAGHADTLAKIGSALTRRKYQVVSVGNVDVLGLKAAARDLALFYFHGHAGAYFWRESDERSDFGLMTDTMVTEANETQFAEDVRQGRLIYTWARSRRADADPADGHGRYVITARFVETYFGFAPRALVYLMACNGGSEKAAAMRQAFQGAGAGTVIGYAGNTTNLSYGATAYFFDRALGANESEAPSPPGRPFTIDQVWEQMGKKGYLVDQPNGSPLVRSGASPAMLAPNIHVLRYYGEDHLAIRTDLPESGTVEVKVGGAVMPHSIYDGMLLVKLAPETTGDVVIAVDGIESNARPIVSWKGPFTYVEYQAPPETGPRLTVTYQMHLRADPYGLRTEVDGPIEEDKATFYGASDSTASYDYSGTLDAVSWTGGATLSFAMPPLDGNFSIAGYVHPNERRLRLQPTFFKAHGSMVNAQGSTPIQRSPNATVAEYLDTELVEGREGLYYGWFVDLADDFSIPARTFDAELEGVPMGQVRWSAMAANPPGSDEVER